MIHFVQALEIFGQEQFLEVGKQSSKPHLIWHGVKLHQPDWTDGSHAIAFSLCHPSAEEHLYVVFNAYWKPLRFELPLLKLGCHWHQIYQNSYRVAPRSSIVLMEKKGILPIPNFSLDRD